MKLRYGIGLTMLAMGLALFAAGYTLGPRPRAELLRLNQAMALGVAVAATGIFFVLTPPKK